ncbi:MAG TPA: LCP family protein [Nocardioides sp.]|jgi:LCP family protein required for cell wall assembly|uniref:LCP family protein n=1 Tax=Nocardioides sp. TaxID=35761 RepID=UPI002E2F5C4D|nr:LCP family protein [Nocardioides sp.]HEX3932158.1 LCP family protein [Nocardioides sp.]
MSALPPDGADETGDPSAGGKRKGRGKVRHTVAKVVTATLVVIALVTGLTVVFLYRHLNHNLDAEDLGNAIGQGVVDKHKWPAPSGPINILVMGSDNRDAPGDHVDNLTGIGQRSDTTILLHLSADRTRAYGVSIPRDSIVDRPACLDNNGKPISAPATDMWNNAFNIGGPACTIRQFESLTHITVDHWIVVDFAGFKSMVDALGGVEVCLPHEVNDPIGHITLPAGTHKFTGTQALDYVRERHDLGNGSDIGRMKRQQAFVASMAHQVLNADMLAKPFSLLRFLDAATKSIHLDEGIGSLKKLAGLGFKFRHIGLNHIQFVTTPWGEDPSDPNRVVWQEPAANQLWNDIRLDKPLPRSLLSGSLNAHQIPGVSKKPKNGQQEQAQASENLANGLCA